MLGFHGSVVRAWCLPKVGRSSLARVSQSSRPDETSQMSHFIRNYLKIDQGTNNNSNLEDTRSNRNKNTQQYLIAFPMETCHELALELESIQRAILYHCPILVHACVPAAALRVPLLQVERMGNKEDAHDLKQLQQCIESVLQEQAMQQDPWMVSWTGVQGKEVDNSVLYATSNEASPMVALFAQNLNHTLQQQAPDWTLTWARHEADQLCLPFMQLPETWETILQQEYNFTTTNNDDDDDIHVTQRYALTSDQGGNGISPLFWIQYMDDTLGQSALRLPEIGLYSQSEHGITSTPWPCSTWTLPVATNQTILRREQEFHDYQAERMQLAEETLRSPKSSDNKKDDFQMSNDDSETALFKSRQQLEKLYAQSGSETSALATTDTKFEKDAAENDFENNNEAINVLETPQDTPELDGWMREKIQNVIASRAREQSLQKLSVKKDKPAIADNPIFAQYKNGTLVPEAPEALSPMKPLLPPFPSREHLVGFWRMVRSPTGFDQLGDVSYQSENLILRIDGTTAGGPVLDQETQQKASGGTWMLSGETSDTSRLRIRLVIPPKKERILVMEGPLERVSMEGRDLPMASNTFGIPALENLKSRNAVEMEDFLFCGGQVWIEDAVTGRNRDDIGSFSVMKLNLSNDPSQYVITVPRPVRNQD